MIAQEPETDQVAFIVMPFASDFDDVHVTIKEAIRVVDKRVKTVRLDEVRAAGSITEDLVAQLRSCTLCVADVTGANANVMWEVGFAAALGKPTIALNQGDGPLPFDIKDVRTLKYDRGSLAKTLREPLTEAVKATLERYTAKRASISVAQQTPSFRSIAVTGTSRAMQEPLRARLAQLLKPYLGKGYHWYVGSVGTTDEVALKFLTDSNEKSIAVVGYNAFDISGQQLSFLESHPHVSFVDASQEQMPRSTDAPTDRDILFAARADLMIVFWDGVSPTIEKLISWLRKQNKDHLLGFVRPMRDAR